MTTYRWTGSHPYRDHANDRVIEPGDRFEADHIAEAHPYDVEEVDPDDGDEDQSESEPDAEEPADEETAGDVCGYFDEETMDSPCQRDAGWGRDANSGRCKDHFEG